MFAKLIKQSIRDTWKVLTVAIILTVVISFSALLMMLSDFTVLQIFAGIGGILAPIALIFGSFIYLARDYYQTMYGKRAYFTHSLPVKSGILLAAKLLWFYLIELVIFVVAILGLVLFSAGESVSSGIIPGVAAPTVSYSEKLDTALQTFGGYFTDVTLPQALVYAGVLLAAVLMWVIWMITCFAIANHRIFNRMSETAAVIISLIGTYLVYQAMSFIAIFAVPVQLLMVTDSVGHVANIELVFGQILGVGSFIEQNAGIKITLGSSYSLIPLGILVEFVLVTVLGYWIAHRMITRHLNLR